MSSTPHGDAYPELDRGASATPSAGPEAVAFEAYIEAARRLEAERVARAAAAAAASSRVRPRAAARRRARGSRRIPVVYLSLVAGAVGLVCLALGWWPGAFAGALVGVLAGLVGLYLSRSRSVDQALAVWGVVLGGAPLLIFVFAATLFLRMQL